MQRGPVDGVLCDVACTGRFYDFFEQRDGRWGIVLRQPIYEKDRLDPVDPAASLTLDPDVLARFPEGYRYLAYLQVPGRVPGQARHAGPDRARGASGCTSAAPPGWPASPSPPSPRLIRDDHDVERPRAVHALDPAELDVAGRAGPADPGERARRVQRRDRVGHGGDDLPGAHHRQVVVRHQA